MRALALAGFSVPLLAAAALHFDGKQELAVPSCPALQISKDITIEAWVKPDAEVSKLYFSYLVSKNMDTTGYGLLTVGREKKVVQATGWPYGLTANEPLIVPGKWTHIAFVRSSTKAVLYINGRIVGSTPVDGPLKLNDLPLYLGSSPFFNNAEVCRWVGALKEVRIWKVARSGSNIRRTMDRRLSPRHRGLAAYFPMNEGRGTLVKDRTGHTPGAVIGSGGPTWVPN